MSELKLAADFPARSYEDWHALAVETLKGGDFERRLVSTTYDGIAVEPLYTAADPLPLPLGPQAPWVVAQRISHPDPARAGELAKEAVAGGAHALVLRTATTTRADGVAVRTLQDLARALADIDLTATPVRLEAGPDALAMAALLDVYLGTRDVAPEESRCALGIDPFAGLLDGAEEAGHPDAIVEAASDAAAGDRGAPVFTVDAHRIHAAGASEAQELGAALAMGVHILRRLDAARIPPEEAQAKIGFVLASDADIFLTIAKFRAWPLLWARVIEACDAPYAPVLPCARTASRMLTRRDPAVNMLRATAAVFAAAAGGAGEIVVDPYTDALGQPAGLARRMARNTQFVLQEESNIHRVADPGAGSWYVESLTGALAAKAWEDFQAIEARGGIVAALAGGSLQAAIGETNARRERDIATRKLPLTGVSEFVDLAEKAEKVDGPPAPAPQPLQAKPVMRWQEACEAAERGELPCAGAAAPKAEALPRVSLAAPYEELRDRSDALLASTGTRPKVFVAALGRLADYTARAGWVRNVFQAGGIEVELHEAGSADDAGAAFASSDAPIACLCASDAEYEASGAAAARALKAAGARHLFLAGRPSEALGIDTAVHVGSDILAVLATAYDAISGSRKP